MVTVEMRPELCRDSVGTLSVDNCRTVGTLSGLCRDSVRILCRSVEPGLLTYIHTSFVGSVGTDLKPFIPVSVVSTEVQSTPIVIIQLSIMFTKWWTLS